MPPQGRPQAGEVQPHQFQPGNDIFQVGMSNQASRGLIWQGSLAGSSGSAAFSGRPRQDRRLGCFASPRVELCHLLASFVGGAVPPQGRPQAAGRSSHTSFSQVSTIFSRQGDVQPGKQRPDLARQPCRELRKCSKKRDVQGEIETWAASQAHAWKCAIYFASFVGGAVPPQGRPQAAGRSSQFQPGTRFFQAGGSNQKASQKPNLFF